MTETTTTDRTPLDEQAVELPTWARRTIITAVIGVLLGISGVVLGGTSVVVYVQQRTAEQQRDGRRDCVARANTRADTIELEHSRFDREARSIEDDQADSEATVDLIEANVMGLVAFAGLDPDTEIVKSSVSNIAARRARIAERAERRAADLAADRVTFDQKRTPLNPADC